MNENMNENLTNEVSVSEKTNSEVSELTECVDCSSGGFVAGFIAGAAAGAMVVEPVKKLFAATKTLISSSSVDRKEKANQKKLAKLRKEQDALNAKIQKLSTPIDENIEGDKA